MAEIDEYAKKHLAHHIKEAGTELILDDWAAAAFYQLMQKMIGALPEFDGYRIDQFSIHRFSSPQEIWVAAVDYKAHQKDQRGFRPYKKINGRGETPIKAFYDLLRFIEVWEQTLQ